MRGYSAIGFFDCCRLTHNLELEYTDILLTAFFIA